MSKRSASTPDSRRSITAAILFAGSATAVVEMSILIFSAPALFSAWETALGALTELLIDLGGLTVLSAIASALFVREKISQKALDFLGKPWKTVFELWRYADTQEESVVRFKELCGKIRLLALFFALLFAGALYVIKSFHEPVRMSLLTAGMGVLALLVSQALEKLAIRPFLLLFFKKGRAGGRLLVRAILIALGALILAGVIVAAVFADEIFGAVDVSLPVAIALFATTASLACAVKIPSLRFFNQKRWSALLGATSFATGMAIIAGSSGARGTLGRSETLGAAVYRATQNLLDFDRDGAAWLIGGDCHPLDPKAGPFAPEVPGNGYDENCDGLDDITAIGDYTDPLDVSLGASRFVKPRGNVLFVIVDAARADHLPTYGYDKQTMPSLDAFSKKSIVFENFFAVSNHTSVTMPSLLTGRYPSSFEGARNVNWGSFGLPNEANSIQLRMKRAKYKTIMYAGHNLWGFLTKFGFLNKDRDNLVKAEDLSAMALASLKEAGPSPAVPQLFCIHFIDPHHPYKAASDPYRFGRSYRDRYDAELAYVDQNLAPILQLMQAKAYSDWLVIVTSDHGEAFGEHGTTHHGFGLYREEVRVPLIVRVPGASAGRVSMASSHLDLVPTIMEWTGLAPDPALPGKSLLPLFSKGVRSDSRRIVFSESFRKTEIYGAFDGGFSLIYRKTDDLLELYEDQGDPSQKDNMYGRISNPVLESALMAHVRAATEQIPMK